MLVLVQVLVQVQVQDAGVCSQRYGSDAGSGKQDQPIANALQGAPRAGAGDWGYRELPAREAGSFIDRIDRDRRA